MKSLLTALLLVSIACSLHAEAFISEVNRFIERDRTPSICLVEALGIQENGLVECEVIDNIAGQEVHGKFELKTDFNNKLNEENRFFVVMLTGTTDGYYYKTSLWVEDNQVFGRIFETKKQKIETINYSSFRRIILDAVSAPEGERFWIGDVVFSQLQYSGTPYDEFIENFQTKLVELSGVENYIIKTRKPHLREIEDTQIVVRKCSADMFLYYYTRSRDLTYLMGSEKTIILPYQRN